MIGLALFSFSFPVLLVVLLTALSFLLFGNVNQTKYGIQTTRRWFPCPVTVTSGMPVLIGTLAGVALDAYDSSLGGTTFELSGSYNLTVIGESAASPVVNSAVKPGDELYAHGTYDSVTNCLTALTLDKNIDGIPFGSAEGAVGSGLTAVISVRLKIGSQGRLGV